MSLTPTIYKKVGNKYIPGQFFRAFVLYNDYYVHTQLRVYADRTIAGNHLFYNLPTKRLEEILSVKLDKKQTYHYTGNAEITFEDFKYLLRKRFVTFNYIGKVHLELWDEPNTNMNDPYYLIDVDESVSDKEYLKSIEDVFRDLNNKPTTTRIFLNTLCEFLQAPKTEKEIYRKKLHRAYLEVPKFERPNLYPLTIDMKGIPIEDILYKRKNRLDNYVDFVKVYDDIYFENKYKK